MPRNGDLSTIIAHIGHGAHAIADTAPDSAELSREGWTKLSDVVQSAGPVGTTDFDYLFKELLGKPDAHLPAGSEDEVTTTVAALNALGNAMIDQEPPADDRSSPIPPVYTYWGQFVDHDLTAATDNDKVISIRDTPLPPLDPDQVVGLLKNARNPALNLDSVYGDGPFAPAPTNPDRIAVPYQAEDRAKLRVGALTPVNVGVRIPPVDDLARDLPRRADKVPLVGDARNDENLVVAQLHVAFLRFHNAAVDWVRANEPQRTGLSDVFLRARDLTRWTYQWLVVHDFLRTVTVPDVVDFVLGSDGSGLLDAAYMPLEFSVAAYRFGHSMIRGAYDWNRNFGRPGNNTLPNASLDLLFRFTGVGGLGGNPTLPSNWPVEWNRFVDKDSLFADRFARRIDTHLSKPLSEMVNQTAGETGGPDLLALLKHLARRNLLRGYRLGLPTGQAVAEVLGLPTLTAAEVAGTGPVADAIQQGGFETRTPLWFYVLRESELKAQGNTLGPVGSRIVAETLIGQLRQDPTSYLHQTSWSPSQGVRLPDGAPIDAIPQFLRFAGVL
ncbi:peroxidase family protein [Actinoplanes sp. CA-030573]|uniref:peroxidase family protein n=1 Tax=Actinoplanes sp. CA-030573 TaxID=3239898 RepID=UPI003D8B78EC